jgi:photosystem II stability/assembly factor-like uncharacterized protein
MRPHHSDPRTRRRQSLGTGLKWLTATPARLAIVVCTSMLVSGEVLAQAVPSVANEPAASVQEAMLDDATLVDVSFVDRQTGWAVGDRGVVWHTRDGGQTWQRQSSGVTCRLSGVFFLDAVRGWAVGGSTRPYTRATQGVVLRTQDGGQTWTAAPGPMLPALVGVRFFDPRHGVAFGRSSSVYPAGLFSTSDGGMSWQPLTTDGRGDWLAGDFIDADTGAAAGPAGRYATVIQRHVTCSPPVGPTLRSFHAMRLLPPVGGWLVGDGGLVMTTRDLGHSWQTLPVDLPANAAEHFDLHAVAVRGEQVWVAGSPGTRVFHSPDGGQNWQPFATSQNVPLRAMTFVDDQNGWAVGDLGTILSTTDGGRSWQAQRAGGRRAALLTVVARPGDVPLELVAQLGAAEGYLAAVDVLHRAAPTDDERTDACTAETTHEAMVLAGAAAADSAWRFPLPPPTVTTRPDDLMAVLNRVNDGRAIERLERHLVEQLRMWRPDVVVTHHARQTDDEPLAAVIEELVMRAVDAAGDPTQYAELAADAGLDAWQVKKVYGLLPAGDKGDQRIATGQFVPRLGCTLADWAVPARGLVNSQYTAGRDMLELKLLLSRTGSSGGGRDLFGGIALSPGSDARRRSTLLAGDVDELRRMAARHRHLQELLQRTAGDAAWAGQVVNLTDGLDADRGGRLLFQLAEGYRAKGQLDLAADTYYLLARRWPDHPLVDQSLVWLVQFYASSEAAQRSCGPIRQGGWGRTAGEPPADVDGTTGVQQASAVGPGTAGSTPTVGLARDDRLRRAVLLGEYLESARPTLYAEPAVRVPLVVAQRQLGYANPAKRYFLSLGRLPESDPWRVCAQTERWLATPDDLPPAKALGNCRRTRERPHLDGRLDEPFWQSADVLRLSGGGGRDAFATGDVRQETNPLVAKASRPRLTAAEVRLAYDDEYLYLAVNCPKAEGLRYDPDDRPRSHDADLSEHDRVSLRLDVDRDYATCFELEVDDRGWTRDACWGDATWNPNWFVAAAGDEAAAAWTIEAAVTLRELVDLPPDARHVWAVGIRRTVPGVGFQSWAGDPAASDPAASDDSPDQFGLVIFE